MYKNKIRDIKELGIVLSRYRKTEQLTQKELANLSGLLQKTISSIETGSEGTRIDTFFKILASLNLELNIQKRGGA